MVEVHPRYISTKFEENPASSFGEEDENVNCSQTDDKDGTTDHKINVSGIFIYKYNLSNENKTKFLP